MMEFAGISASRGFISTGASGPSQPRIFILFVEIRPFRGFSWLSLSDVPFGKPSPPEHQHFSALYSSKGRKFPLKEGVEYLSFLSAETCTKLFYVKLKGKKAVTIFGIENSSPWIVAHSDVILKRIE